MKAAGSVRMSSSTSQLRFCVVMENATGSDQAVRGIPNHYTSMRNCTKRGRRQFMIMQFDMYNYSSHFYNHKKVAIHRLN